MKEHDSTIMKIQMNQMILEELKTVGIANNRDSIQQILLDNQQYLRTVTILKNKIISNDKTYIQQFANQLKVSFPPIVRQK